MKIKILVFVILTCVIILQHCKRDVSIKDKPTIVLNADFLSILNHFISSISPVDSTSVFIIVKNIDANSAQYYLVAKKPLRTDFTIIGIPFTSTKIDEVNVYFFNGTEKIVSQDDIFWKKHSEIFDDREKQISSIYETPIIKKEAYLYDNDIWHKKERFDDMIFTGNPIDTLRFMYNK